MIKMRGWLMGLTVSIALTGTLAGCRTNTALNSTETASPGQQVAQDRLSTSIIENTGVRENTDGALNSQPPQPPSMAATTNSLPPLPHLIPSTPSSAQLPPSEIGRVDPFTTVIVPPTVSVQTTSVQATSPPALVAPTSTAAPPIVAPVTAAPMPLPVLQSAPVDINPFPPVLPALPPRRLSEAIEISGVVEVGGKTNVIVQVPDEQTSRYVQVGEYVSDGNVLVKRVEMGVEPVVILEENGAEVTRYVGSASPSPGLL